MRFSTHHHHHRRRRRVVRVAVVASLDIRFARVSCDGFHGFVRPSVNALQNGTHSEGSVVLVQNFPGLGRAGRGRKVPETPVRCLSFVSCKVCEFLQVDFRWA